MPVATGTAIAGGVAAAASAIGAGAAAVGGGSALAGAATLASAGAGVIGGLSNKGSSSSSTLNLAPASALEQQAAGNIAGDYGQLRGLVDAGPGASDVTAGVGSQRDLAGMLQQYQQSGGLPSGTDVTQAQGLAGGLFQGRRNALTAGFEDQRQQASQNAAVMGRNLNDPVLRNKLAQEQTRQSLQLEAEQGSLANQLALQQPDRRLGYAQSRANVLGGLASQAMSNRQALLGIGEGIQTNERNFRLQSAGKTSSATQEGSFAQGLAGGLAGLGAGLKGSAGAGGFGGNSATFNEGGSNLGSYFGGSNPFSGGGGAAGAAPSLGVGSSMALSPSNEPSLLGRGTVGGRR